MIHAKQCILCVDDEKIVLDSTKAQLKAHFGDKFYYEMAENADEAMEIIEELTAEGTQIHLIVSDWLMPGIKGDEFLVNVHKKYPDIVSIMLTGQADDSAIKNAQNNAGLYKCLPKPWSEMELISAVENGLKNIK